MYYMYMYMCMQMYVYASICVYICRISHARTFSSTDTDQYTCIFSPPAR